MKVDDEESDADCSQSKGRQVGRYFINPQKGKFQRRSSHDTTINNMQLKIDKYNATIKTAKGAQDSTD